MALTAPIVGGKGSVPLPEAVFGVEASAGLLHEVVTAENAGRRQGTHATKTRGMVAGGRAKPFRQKGTGRARQGTTRAAQFTGGGVVFGPQPRSYAVKVNKKAYRKARCMGLSQHARLGTIGVFAAGGFESPKTKDALKLVDGWMQAPLVVVVQPEEEAAALSFRNLPRSAVLTPAEVGVGDLLWARRLLVSEAALAEIVRTLGPAAKEAVA
ncbi:MAG: 50S ribosomal protein L4 [Actinobacteria bacterium]|nr:50S ribosomal protein L4 [Actinomycetota bacterium]